MVSLDLSPTETGQETGQDDQRRSTANMLLISDQRSPHEHTTQKNVSADKRSYVGGVHLRQREITRGKCLGDRAGAGDDESIERKIERSDEQNK